MIHLVTDSQNPIGFIARSISKEKRASHVMTGPLFMEIIRLVSSLGKRFTPSSR